MMTNLLLNARDAIASLRRRAMRRGRQRQWIIIVETENAVYDEAFCLAHAGFLPGQYVRLAVSDDGCGMDWQPRSDSSSPITHETVGQGGASVWPRCTAS